MMALFRDLPLPVFLPPGRAHGVSLLPGFGGWL